MKMTVEQYSNRHEIYDSEIQKILAIVKFIDLKKDTLDIRAGFYNLMYNSVKKNPFLWLVLYPMKMLDKDIEYKGTAIKYLKLQQQLLAKARVLLNEWRIWMAKMGKELKNEH